MIKKLLFSSLLLLSFQAIIAQPGAPSLRGKVTYSDNDSPVEDASVVLAQTGKFTATDANGNYVLTELKPGKYTLVITRPGYLPEETPVNIPASGEITVDVKMRRDPANTAGSGDIPTITLDEAESETEGAGEVANLLHASRDVFQNIAGFGWSTFRFRERGYDSGLFELYLNGVQFNDPETGWTPYGEIGGLNDVLRNRSSTVGLDPSEMAFGNLGGVTMIDTRASTQRKQFRASFAQANRLYRNRFMMTLNTGLMPGGWAVSASYSTRWAHEGYVPGTFYDAHSYFLSVDKKFSEKHSLNLTFFGAPTQRGRSADSFQEMYDIAGTNFYNPLWGYQNGEKRNAQVSTNHQPTAILRYDWAPSIKTHLIAAAYGQYGKSSFTRINWVNAFNPAPDFNRRLPSSMLDPVEAANWTEMLRQNEGLRQIDWAALYEANRNNPFTLQNAEGIPGNTVSGRRAAYIVEDNRADNREAGANVAISHALNNRVSLNGGAQYVYYRGLNFKVVDDLLGADFWADWDFFGQFENADAISGRQSDLLHPNNLVQKGDVFGYDYDENINRANAWAQAQFSLKRFQFFISGEAGQTRQWRTGNMQNGRFPNNSLGDSEKLDWNTWGAKGGAVWKINGRNYLYANGYYGKQAPQFRAAFLSPRVRNTVAPGVQLSTVQSVEGGYLLRAPKVKARITGYYSEFLGETESVFANSQTVSRVLSEYYFGDLNIADGETFLQVPIFFGGAVMTGVDRRHTGVEIGVEAKPVPSWIFSAAASIGKYIYTSRPTLYLAPDNSNVILDAGLVYQENYYVPRTPQTAASVSARYEAKNFWAASITVNYADQLWYDFDRVRHTSRFVSGQTPESPLWNTIIEQKKAAAAFTVDIFANKSWKIGAQRFLYLNVGINNLLNNQDIVIAGRDSYRNAFRSDVADARFYTSELVYAPGLNYFVQLAISIR